MYKFPLAIEKKRYKNLSLELIFLSKVQTGDFL